MTEKLKCGILIMKLLKKRKRGTIVMKRHNILLIAALTATLCISGCGKQEEESSSEIPNITVESEDLPRAN